MPLRRVIKAKSVAIGLAMFAMFFGAGNVVFPLLLGAASGDRTGWAMTGLLITAVVVPFLGIVSVVAYDSDHKLFFGRIGKVPGYLLAAFILLLIGPFGGIPRTIALSYSTLSVSLPGLPIGWFSLVFCLIAFFLSWKETRVVDILGFVLTPLLLLSLVTIILLGLINPPPPLLSDISPPRAFLSGLAEGYNTLDLLAACFFSSVVFIALRRGFPRQPNESYQKLSRRRLRVLARASILGAVLLALVYTGLSFVSAFYHEPMQGVGGDQLLGAIALHLAGPTAGIVANVAIILACLTTAITLCAVFADVLSTEILRDKISYTPALVLTLVVAYFISYLNFTGIVRAIAPIVVLCYPALITLTACNLAYKLWNFRPVKTPVAAVFILTILGYVLL